MRGLVFDIECDGLNPTKIHCLAKSATDKDEVSSVISYGEMVSSLETEEVLVGHNIIRFDIPVCEKLLGLKTKAKLVDTLILSWYLEPDRSEHGLESWGETFGVPKPPVEDWENLPVEV